MALWLYYSVAPITWSPAQQLHKRVDDQTHKNTEFYGALTMFLELNHIPQDSHTMDWIEVHPSGPLRAVVNTCQSQVSN